MANPLFWQRKFDPSETFIVAGWPPGYSHRGATLRRGEVFNKSGVRHDRLRGLYEARWIRLAEPGELPSQAAVQDLINEPETPPKTRKARSGRGEA